MIEYHQPDREWAQYMWSLAKDNGLDLNSSYSYIMMANFFNDRCLVAYDRENDVIVGFVMGFVLKDDIYFVWQICVDKTYRGMGISSELLERVYEENKKNGVRFIQATVEKDNDSSMALFKSMAKKHDTFFSIKEGFNEELFPDEKPAEKLLQIGPLK